MASNRRTPKLKLKLLVDRAQRKVVFAEAGKDAIDFLFGILALPLGEVVRLLGKQSMVGSLGKLYGSVQSLDRSYVQANQSKHHLLAPRVASPAFAGNAGAALTWNNSAGPGKYYRCDGSLSTCCSRYYSDGLGATCPLCLAHMNTEMKYIPPPPAGTKKMGSTATSSGGSSGAGEGGFVKGMVTYMVTDDLTVAPMSTISSIALLSKCGLNMGSLEEWTVDLDMSKALEMLQASLYSTTVLTDVFLTKQPKRDRAFM